RIDRIDRIPSDERVGARLLVRRIRRQEARRQRVVVAAARVLEARALVDVVAPELAPIGRIRGGRRAEAVEAADLSIGRITVLALERAEGAGDRDRTAEMIEMEVADAYRAR